jgi:signal transduction histidine kinase
MVDIIASRAAGFKLTWIIVALLVPIVFLGYFMFSTLRQERAIVQIEADGAALQNLLTRIYVDSAVGHLNPDAVQAIVTEGAPIAQRLKITSGFSNLVEILEMKAPSMGAVMASSQELIALNAQASGVILDVEAETFYLASSISQNLPKLVADFKALQFSAQSAVTVGNSQIDGLSQLLLDAGRLSASGDRVISDIRMASTVTNQPTAYAEMGKLNASIRARISNFGVATRKSFINPDALSPAKFFVSDRYAKPILEEYGSLWQFANQRFSNLMAERLDRLNKKMGIMFGVSLAAVSLGLGLALKMFQSTLKQLDEVQLAKRQAELAQVDAESMNDQLGIVNDNMVSMNHELARNMQMLKDAQDALVKKGRMEQMGQLTATIAHELRNPLGAVRTSAFLIERKIRDKGLGIEQQLQRINNGITRCDGIITQLLDFSRTKQLVARAGDLDHWLATTIEEEAKTLPAAVSIQCHLGLGTIQVPFDPDRLHRAVINLIGNASEAMVGNGDDPSRFTVSDPQITLTTSFVGGMIEISISDNGPGISPENLEKIREPLFTTKSFGTGLGIPAVEQIAHQHGGSLDIQSELGKGASFIIKLPLVTPEEIAA